MDTNLLDYSIENPVGSRRTNLGSWVQYVTRLRPCPVNGCTHVQVPMSSVELASSATYKIRSRSSFTRGCERGLALLAWAFALVWGAACATTSASRATLAYTQHVLNNISCILADAMEGEIAADLEKDSVQRVTPDVGQTDKSAEAIRIL